MKNLKTNNTESSFTQDLIGIEEIIGGMIFMKDGTVIKILEILPLNFFELPEQRQANIAFNFGYAIKQCPGRGHIKIMSTKTDLRYFEQYIRRATVDDTDPNLLRRIDDYINHTKSLQMNNSERNRFFYIFKYEGDNKGKKSTNIDDIYNSMMNTTYSVKAALASTGNIVIDFTGPNGTNDLIDLLYDFYNSKSKTTDTEIDRNRNVSDSNYYLQSSGLVDSNSYPPLADLIAPRGIKFGKWDYMIMDGMYYTFLSLKNNAFPQQTTPGDFCFSLLRELKGCDLDIFFEEQNRDRSLYLLDRVNVIKTGLSMDTHIAQDRAEKLSTEGYNAKFIKECMTEGDENLYNVSVIVTIKARTKKELYNIRDSYVKTMRTRSYYFDQCFLNVQDYFKMIQPYMYINSSIMNANCRNMTNRSMASLYCFTSFEIYDKNGYCLGTTLTGNQSLMSIDNFNSSKFPNPHIFLCGTSGAGKTFTECMLASRMRMHGIRTMFILPLKGYEYRKNVASLGGEFISLRPGGDACINIFGILSESQSMEEGDEQDEVSMLARKITSILTWLRLLFGRHEMTREEQGEFNALLIELYKDFGITMDNKTVFIPNTRDSHGNPVLKTMPTISDFYKKVVESPTVAHRAPIIKEWVKGMGSCGNMDGQTNINLNAKTLAFDVNEDYINDELLPAFMYMAFDICYSIAKRDLTEKCAVILDEVWKLLVIDECAKQVFKMIKILRGYGSCAVTGTQDIEDCLRSEYGRAILTNSAIKIFLKMTNEELEYVTRSVTLSEQNKLDIVGADKGIGFITYGTERIKVNFIASKSEFDLYNTDVTKRKSKSI